ncbi:ParA family protein (plasmid) [Trichlorobacter lovleyi]|uniref:ParA family protein n=1 Tax=Trichlorobacter lovleyi TaxID=313985 RepID=UPI002240A74F|nr:AAA family ATPase [Trichlorobacter lovleyi]QOX80854.1 ParA family protein [Trichlorobacter lovleyi]
MKQRIIVYANQKGGVGKTTTVANLSAALALTGRRVLLVDMDPQGNASTHLNVKPAENQKSTYDLLLKECPLKDVVVTAKENLDVVPAGVMLANAEAELVVAKGSDSRLKRGLANATNYHYILIDCPPSLGQLTVNAMTAANEVMVVVEAEGFAYEGTAYLLKVVEETRKYCNPLVKITGLICTKFVSTLKLSKDIHERLTQNFGEVMFKTNIRKNVKLAEAAAAKKDIFEYDENCTGAQDYAALCKEIIEQEGNQ